MSVDITTLVLATRNQGKIQELREILSTVRYDLEVIGLDRFPGIGKIPETGSTFEENARIKAEAVSRATGLIAVADDSGLEVPALGNEPGVYSARYAGESATDEENNSLLLQRLKHLSWEDRWARFVCVLAAISPGGKELVVRGEWPGLILEHPRGEGGFGYDPIFLDTELGLTASEMNLRDKNQRSHRGRALNQLVAMWDDFLERLSP